MLTENKFSKYLIYAIGEIILVVIGILIALQINNWNEDSKQRIIEQKYLISLKEEFAYNLLELDSLMKRNKFNEDNALELSSHMGPDIPSISEKEFADLVQNMTNWEVIYHPNQAVLDEIISSGKLAIFSDDKLKFALSSYYGKLSRIKFQEEELNDVRMKVNDILNSKGNAKKLIIDEKWDSFGISESKFTLGNNHLLQSLEFDNQLVDFILTARYLNTEYYSELKNEMDLVIKLIREELNE